MTYEKNAPEALPMTIDAQDVIQKVEYREVQRIHSLPSRGKVWMSDTKKEHGTLWK